MGYGPLVRASCGVSALWREPDLHAAGAGAVCDGATVYPDHVAGHLAAAAVLAALIGRERTGRGTSVQMAQADVAVMHLGPLLAAAREPDAAAGPPVSAGVFRCAGDDEWCVIEARDDADRARLAGLLGQDAGDLDRWTATRRRA